MGYELIITEKPSAAMKMAYALADTKPIKKTHGGVGYYLISHNRKDIVIAAAVGHLYTVAEKKDNGYKYPSYDIEWVPSASKNDQAAYTKKYVNTIKHLAKEADSFTVACDYDIEGEVIGLNCIRFICKQKDANRMKFSTLTKPDLIESYKHKDKTLNWGQANAGETRHFLDWLYGINLSRALSAAIQKKGHKAMLSTGRVQGPALKLITDKEKEIHDFKPTPYWQLELKGLIKKESVTAQHEKGNIFEEKEAKEILKKTKGKDGKVTNINEEEKTHIPPYAFDLTTLQIESYRSLRITPKQTLAIAQNLYVGGYISYPRTSSQKLPPTIGYKKIIEALKNDEDYTKICEEILGKEKVYPRQGGKDDPAHPAIYPTGHIPKKPKAEEKRVYDLIVRRFLSAFGSAAKRMHTHMDITVEEEKFIAEGKVTIEKGWYVYYGRHLNVEEKIIPKAKKGSEVKVESITELEKETEPPRRYSPATIIRELENRNLGTKSTRAHIIDTLYHRNFIKGTQLEATDLGIGVATTLSKYSPKIVDEELTREFEEEMEEIREHKKTKDQIINRAKEVLNHILDNFHEHESSIGKELVEAHTKTEEKDTIGKCPKCGGHLLVKKGKFGRFIACDKYPECETTYNVPNMGFLEATHKTCKECKMPTIYLKFKGRKKQEVCINPKCPLKHASGDTEEEIPCPECKNGILKLRSSMYGQFLGCSNYPKCKHTEKIEKMDNKKKNKKTNNKTKEISK